MSVLVIGNPVMSSAEALAEIAEYSSYEEAQKAIEAAILDEPEQIGPCVYTFKEGTPFRNFNLEFWDGKLKRRCFGESLGGYWVSHGRCLGSMNQEEYTDFGSPSYLIKENGK